MQTATATIIDLGTVRLTRRVPLTAEQHAYYTRAAQEEAEYQAQVRAQGEAHDAALWAWLGDRTAANIEEFTGSYDRKVMMIGKTVEAVEAEIASYNTQFPSNVYFTRFDRIEPWHHGFMARGSRWSFS